MANDKKNMNLLRNKPHISASIYWLYIMDKADAQAKKHAERDTNKNLAPAASMKLAEK